jgi:hypothetical protein
MQRLESYERRTMLAQTPPAQTNRRLLKIQPHMRWATLLNPFQPVQNKRKLLMIGYSEVQEVSSTRKKYDNKIDVVGISSRSSLP